jgi:YbbR domain-containing protein
MIRYLRRLFFRNWALKLLSVVLAFALWLTLVPEEKIFSEKTLDVPLEIRNLPAEYEIVQQPLDGIDVTLRAPNRLLAQVAPPDIQVVLNLQRATVNQEDYPLNPDMVIVPPNVKVVRVLPNKVHLKLDRSKEVIMEVTPVLIGKVKAGMKIERVEVVPSKVFVRGPESVIKPGDRVRTSPVDVTELAETKSFDADLILPKPNLRFATGLTRSEVKVIIAPK